LRSERDEHCALFFVQLVLNAAWSWMFFAANSPLLGMVNIVPQFALIIATVVAFYRLDRLAAYCLVPLTAWVAFATSSTSRSGYSIGESATRWLSAVTEHAQKSKVGHGQ